jgi:prepilin-type N-terminal cleavage/methylation domain-containing protein
MSHLIARAGKRLAGEGGFTLIELMVTIGIGVLVLTAALDLMDSTGNAGSRVSDKSETVQRLRGGLDRATRILRTQVCADSSTPPIISGDGDSVTFYSDTGTDTTFAPRKIRLSMSSGTLFEEIWLPTNTSSPWAYPADPDSAKQLLENGTTLDASTAVFSYYSFADLSTKLTTPLDTSLSDPNPPPNSVTKVVRVDVALRAVPQSGNPEARRQMAMTSAVYTRNADFSGTSNSGRTWGPRCA